MEQLKVIQELVEGDQYEVENTENAFAAEQSVPNDADMQVHPEYQEVDDLSKQFDNLQIKMVGQEHEEERVDDEHSDDDFEDILNKNEEDFKPSKKHINYTSIEERA